MGKHFFTIRIVISILQLDCFLTALLHNSLAAEMQFLFWPESKINCECDDHDHIIFSASSSFLLQSLHVFLAFPFVKKYSCELEYYISIKYSDCSECRTYTLLIINILNICGFLLNR